MVTRTRGVAPRWLLAVLVGAELAAVAGLGIGGRPDPARRRRERETGARLTAELGLTGLALGSESGYARQPALAVPGDALSAHPAALDTFPSGSVIPPPAHIVGATGSRALEGP